MGVTATKKHNKVKMGKIAEAIMDKYPDEVLKFADGLDDAIIGIDVNSFNAKPRIVYSISKCIDILAKDMEVSKSDLEKGETMRDKKYELAREHFEYNVSGGYVGEDTPIWVDDEL